MQGMTLFMNIKRVFLTVAFGGMLLSAYSLGVRSTRIDSKILSQAFFPGGDWECKLLLCKETGFLNDGVDVWLELYDRGFRSGSICVASNYSHTQHPRLEIVEARIDELYLDVTIRATDLSKTVKFRMSRPRYRISDYQ